MKNSYLLVLIVFCLFGCGDGKEHFCHICGDKIDDYGSHKDPNIHSAQTAFPSTLDVWSLPADSNNTYEIDGYIWGNPKSESTILLRKGEKIKFTPIRNDTGFSDSFESGELLVTNQSYDYSFLDTIPKKDTPILFRISDGYFPSLVNIQGSHFQIGDSTGTLATRDDKTGKWTIFNCERALEVFYKIDSIRMAQMYDQPEPEYKITTELMSAKSNKK